MVRLEGGDQLIGCVTPKAVSTGSGSVSTTPQHLQIRPSGVPPMRTQNFWIWSGAASLMATNVCWDEKAGHAVWERASKALEAKAGYARKENNGAGEQTPPALFPDISHLSSRVAPHDARLSPRSHAAALEKGGPLAQAATREARVSSRPWG